MTTSVHLGISTCPNDTFAFHGLLERKVDWQGLDFQVALLDVEQLNRALFSGKFDVAKASFHAALLLADELGVLPSGSALGFGVGPLLLAAREGRRPDEVHRESQDEYNPPIVLCPGEHTTATLLYKMFFPNCGTVQQVVFSDIMPALAAGEADFGVCIHEGRFTYQQNGLGLAEDLGRCWEQVTSTPLPLGGIVARKSIGDQTLEKVQQVIRDSLEYGLSNRAETLTTMRRYAQELSDEVIFAHVDLYVNKWTRDLGDEGKKALQSLAEQAALTGAIPAKHRELDIIGV